MLNGFDWSTRSWRQRKAAPRPKKRLPVSTWNSIVMDMMSMPRLLKTDNGQQRNYENTLYTNPVCAYCGFTHPDGASALPGKRTAKSNSHFRRNYSYRQRADHRKWGGRLRGGRAHLFVAPPVGSRRR